jgi:hypothetical protein
MGQMDTDPADLEALTEATVKAGLERVDSWVAANTDLVTRVFEAFRTTGSWPPFDQVQWQLDEIPGSDAPQVDQVWNEAPPGATYLDQSGNANRAALQVMALAHVPSAAPLLDKFIGVLRLAMEKYRQHRELLTSDEILEKVPVTKEELPLVLILLQKEWPLQVNVATRDNGWEWKLDPGNRQFRNVATLEDLINIQAQLRFRPNQAPKFVGSLPSFPDVGEMGLGEHFFIDTLTPAQPAKRGWTEGRLANLIGIWGLAAVAVGSIISGLSHVSALGKVWPLALVVLGVILMVVVVGLARRYRRL